MTIYLFPAQLIKAHIWTKHMAEITMHLQTIYSNYDT